MQDSASYSQELSLDLPVSDAMKPAVPHPIQVIPKPEMKLTPKLVVPELSNRESEIVMETIRGRSNKETANLLFVTEKTVKFHLTNIYKKCGVVSRAQLIVKMNAAGVVAST